MSCPKLVENTKGDCTERSWYPYRCAVTDEKISSDEEYRHCRYSSDYEKCRAYKERQGY
jgi:hypothetical protein